MPYKTIEIPKVAEAHIMQLKDALRDCEGVIAYKTPGGHIARLYHHFTKGWHFAYLEGLQLTRNNFYPSKEAALRSVAHNEILWFANNRDFFRWASGC